MRNYLLYLLFPPKCIFCDKLTDTERFSICEKCVDTISYNSGLRCLRCDVPLDVVYGDMLCFRCREHRRAFDRVHAPLIYKAEVRESILGFKFHGRADYAKTLAALMFIRLREEAPDLSVDAVTYVPLHPARLGARGYNQAQLLAKELSKLLRVPLLRTLCKTKNTTPLSRLRLSDRAAAVREVFAPQKKIDVRNKHLLLVDDIITTGATLNVCARILRRAGATRVTAVTAAATPQK